MSPNAGGGGVAGSQPMSTALHMVPPITNIYLPRVLCLSYSCHIPVVLSVIVAEAILYVLVIKLTKETRRRVCRWRDYRWRDRKGTDQRGRV